jgi:hypothetical protein
VNATLLRIDELAQDVGTLRRRPTNDYSNFLLDRIAFHVQALDALAFPTASDFYQAGATVPEALAIVDERTDRLRRVLGERP